MRQLSVSHLRGADNLVKALELLPFEIVYRGKVLGVCVGSPLADLMAVKRAVEGPPQKAKKPKVPKKAKSITPRKNA